MAELERLRKTGSPSKIRRAENAVARSDARIAHIKRQMK